MSENIHFIAIGGSAMHNLALALHDAGHIITGSDDEIYEPSRTRLKKAGILPDEMGWSADRIHDGLHAVILGMHAKPDNPELAEALSKGIRVYSYPEYVAKAAEGQKCVVVAGSHGKTTTTAMIMHVLGKHNLSYDYLVGAQLEGFDRMVKLSGAPIIILEGDEYLSSPIDRRPKMMHYKADIAVVTGVAWDHINVFSTYEIYEDQFRHFIRGLPAESSLIYYAHDDSLGSLVKEDQVRAKTVGYEQIPVEGGKMVYEGHAYDLGIIGNHNLQNMAAAKLVCEELGLTAHEFFVAIQDFKGAAKRLQFRGKRGGFNVYQDFAHAPSKVKATCDAVKDWFGQDKLYAVFELHTFSSLNKEFLPLYKDALQSADHAYVVYDEHTLRMKGMPALSPEFVGDQFGHTDLKVLTSHDSLSSIMDNIPRDGHLLMMSSGTFGGLDWDQIVD